MSNHLVSTPVQADAVAVNPMGFDRARPSVARARRVVIKLGTRVLMNDDQRLATERIHELIRVMVTLQAADREVVVVSSGAFGIGRATLCDTDDAIDDPTQRRACASVGQARLVSLYQRAFARHDLACAQVLLTEEDFDHRKRYLDLRATLDRLLDAGVVPLLNENDAVSHGTMPRLTGGDAIFGDNDRLAALVAAKCDADLLVLLTDVEGVYERNPRRDPNARVIDHVDDLARLIDGLDPAADTTISRGGMRTKVEAARVAAFGGCDVVIASGRRPCALAEVVAGHATGTWLPPVASLTARRRWIGFAAASKGILRLDAGAVEALHTRHASLLPVGVSAIEGEFRRGDVIELRDPNDRLIGRGLTPWNVDEIRRWVEQRMSPFDLDGRTANCLLRRTDVVLAQPC
ncbi:MAG: glutamate 5-kinase [Acidobacteriota bacterium]